MSELAKKEDESAIKEQNLSRADVKVTSVIMGFTMIAALVMILLFGLIICYNFISGGASFKESPGQIGDIIGGVSSPIIGIISAMITFLAFWIQFSFNRVQTIKIDKQRIDQERARIEGLIFEMIRIHRENVSDVNIKEISKGRRAFISMFKEFKFCYYVLKIVSRSYPNIELDEEKLINISFITFFFGIGESSEEIVESLLKDYDDEFIANFYRRLYSYQADWNHQKRINDFYDRSPEKYLESSRLFPDQYPAEGMPLKIDLDTRYNSHGIPEYSLTIGYKPFNGHLGRLGHYFRHLYQTVDFIANQDKAIIHDDLKYNYIRTLRAQISAHEQLLLYFNSLTVMGKPWWEKKLIINKTYITDFKMVKNMPLPLANIGPNLEDKFGEDYFEWSEITSSVGKD